MSDPVIESQEIKETQEFPSILKMLKGAKKTKGAKGVKGTMRNSEKWWEMVRNDEKQWKTMRNSERRQETMRRNGEKQWETMRNGEKQWETVRNSEKQWEMGRNGEKRWETMGNGEKRGLVWSCLVMRTWYILASMLKIYMYWNKCSCHRRDIRNVKQDLQFNLIFCLILSNLERARPLCRNAFKSVYLLLLLFYSSTQAP